MELATIGVVGLGERAPGTDVVAGSDLGLPVGRGNAAEVVEQGKVVAVGQVVTAQPARRASWSEVRASPRALSNGASSARSVASETAANSSARRTTSPGLRVDVSIGALTRLPSRQDYQVAVDPWRETPASPVRRWLLGHRFLVVSQQS